MYLHKFVNKILYYVKVTGVLLGYFVSCFYSDIEIWMACNTLNLQIKFYYCFNNAVDKCIIHFKHISTILV